MVSTTNHIYYLLFNRVFHCCGSGGSGSSGSSGSSGGSGGSGGSSGSGKLTLNFLPLNHTTAKIMVCRSSFHDRENIGSH